MANVVQDSGGAVANISFETMKISPKAAVPPVYWIVPLCVVLLIVAFHTTVGAGRAAFHIGHLLSNEIYTTDIILSVGILLLTARRVPGTGIAWWPLDMSLCSLLIVQATKAITQLPRPSGGHSGFPSGHTTYSFALATLLSQAYPRLTPLWFAIATAIGWSRVEVHAHFPYQVYTGAILGTAIALVVSHVPRGIIFPRCLPKK